ncbi:MAG: 50S ribosomal protein L21 [Planctomycetota bacterium]
MYAVISDRSRQIGVRVGDVVVCDASPDAQGEDCKDLLFDRVLLVSNEGEVRVGTPTVEGASVKGEVLGAFRGKKCVVFRFKKRKNVRVKRGHRQDYVRVRITEINA